ncbi:endonuclease/exonuclease/phosphatase family protein [Tanticharoenia sakaeratensis]|jgi:endonuclease/exonuclease/phosphatase family metal-dependent hydrolase|uniref:Endonuclease/exonuclease/phosphatase domain-containing protein n=1 Tax=Tanticharoenia sakaeratensis NBRC 103193 TaxID=1231623 RepID=A0A0D6MMW5_9PROT|nr:endonuclease/exonuclease/phosphatase family protein [Tanticharoenia sakaeratensis]GAN55032.1 hypothetical protein Tasa_038_013 [Tanticharoenia sakaeratensis NBRC 103193]GBQ20016.1 hypothetical protein AA103193_1237 [Tanticharoenia sakaeratensis NBRC 103193]
MMTQAKRQFVEPDADEPAVPQPGQSVTVASWNLLRRDGATLREVIHVFHALQPDIFLMQEAMDAIDDLPLHIGGHYARIPLPGRPHGTACWSRYPFERTPVACALPPGLIVRRTAQIIDFGTFSVANVHLSHGQILNRRQLHRIAQFLRPRSLIMGDFNLVGPVMLKGFRDVGPRATTHRMVDVVPIRIDRCLVRGMTRERAQVMPNYSSDHHPIAVKLRLDP